ncbi:MAG: hypothetical protein AAFR14_04690, partial [Bacteroidota bacterium]
MKRMNSTFFLLFALLSFVSTSMSAQGVTGSGTACIAELNVTVAADCNWQIDRAQLTSNMLADSLWVYPHDPELTFGPGAFTGSGVAFSGGAFQFQTKFPKGRYIYELYEGDIMACWGHINIEHKLFPEPMTSTDTTDCVWAELGGLPWPTFRFSDFLNSSNCYAWPKTGDIREEVDLIMGNDELCDTLVYVRTIESDFEVDKRKRAVTLRIDTMVVPPLDTSEICLPPNWVEIECDFLPADFHDVYDVNDGKDHEEIAELFDNDNIAAYWSEERLNPATFDTSFAPYIKKEASRLLDRWVVCVEERKFDTGIDTLVQVETKDGGYVWTSVDVFEFRCSRTETRIVPFRSGAPKVEKETINDVSTGTDFGPCETYPRFGGTFRDNFIDYLPMPKGTTCNFNLKCTTWVLEGECEKLPVAMRRWELLNWCNKSVVEYNQFIKVVDTQAPRYKRNAFVYGGRTLTASIAPWTCAGELVYRPDVEDWSDYEVHVKLSEGYAEAQADKRGVVIRGLWLSASPITVEATVKDWCGNELNETFTIVVTDDVAPVAIAEDQVNVSLTGDHNSADLGVAKVYTDAIDAGSHDAGCGKVKTCLLRKDELDAPIFIGGLEFVRSQEGFTSNGGAVFTNGGERIYEAMGCDADGVVRIYITDAKGKAVVGVREVAYVVCKDYVKVCCDDDFAITGEFVQVALVVEDEAGNTSSSWADLRVENKTRPFVECNDIEVDCDFGEKYDPSGLRQPKVWDICGEKTLDFFVDEGEIDACGDGRITRTWFYEGDVICVQRIFSNGTSDFDPYSIKWPAHQDGTTIEGVRRECENKAGFRDPVIVEYFEDVAMGDALECSGEPMGEPVWCNPACALIGVNFEDETVEAGGNNEFCKKIIRRWTVIDWCTWEANGTDIDDENDSKNDQFEAVNDKWLPGPVAANVAQHEECEDCPKPSGPNAD